MRMVIVISDVAKFVFKLCILWFVVVGLFSTHYSHTTWIYALQMTLNTICAITFGWTILMNMKFKD